MAFLLRIIKASLSKQKPLDAFKHFLEHDAGSSIRQAPHQKDRKYVHVEIAQKFKKQEEERKQLRLEQMKLRKLILQQKITAQSKLLTSTESEELASIEEEIRSIEQLVSSQQKQLKEIDKVMQQTEANLVLVEGYKKLVVLNQIEYLKHMSYHPTGLVLHPNTIQIIENVHYLVNNNLPVNKFKLYEIMPELFQTEIKQLDQSIQRLIQQKQLRPESDSSSRIRFFGRHHSRFKHPEQAEVIDLDEERQAIFQNLQQDIARKLQPHQQYIKLVQQGKTPFRSSHHMISTFLSTTLNLKFTPQEEKLKATLIEIGQLKDKFQVYSDEIDKKKIEIRFRYIEPPVWIKNHPVLLERYEQAMLKYTNPIEVQPTLEIQSKFDDGGRAYLSEKLNKLIAEKYHPRIEELWNSGKREELIAMKKELQISFYNDSTKILQEYNEMLLEKQEKEEFLKIPKKTREIAQKKHTELRLDDLTKTVFINNSNPQTYNLGFFKNYLGLEDEEETRKLFNSFSYLRVKEQKEATAKELQFQIIKFKEA